MLQQNISEVWSYSVHLLFPIAITQYQFTSVKSLSIRVFNKSIKVYLGWADSDIPRVWWWDLGVPLFTWVIISLFLIVPAQLRFLPMIFMLAPVALGSCRSAWWIATMRRLAEIKKFSIQRNATLPEGRTCILGIHPHGKYPMSIFPSFETRPDMFSNFVMAQSSLGKYVPTVGWITMLNGRVIDASKRQISKAIASGKHVGVMPGGALEMVHCEPFSSCIPLIKHSGFLRLAYSLATSNCDGNAPCVVPCFVFGLYDSYTNPLAGLDATLYRMTGANLPLWLPTLKGDHGTHMVVGDAINPLDFGNDEDFATAYYISLEKLFEANKGRFVAYKRRRLQWVSVEPRQRMRRKMSQHIWTTGVPLFFLTMFLSFFVLSGKLLRLSTLEFYDSHRYGRILAMHFISCLVWVLATASITIKGFNSRHRMIGYIAFFSSAIMCGSACHLTIASWADALKEQSPTANHVLFQTFSNLQVASLTQMILGYAISAARARKGAKHALYMGLINKLLVVSFLPRLTAIAIRWLLPSLLDSTSAFSVACLLNWWMQLKALRRMKDQEVRRVLTSMNMTCALFALTALIGEWQLGFPMAISYVGPFTTFLVGVAM